MAHDKKLVESLLMGIPTEAMLKFEEGMIAQLEAMENGDSTIMAIATALQMATLIPKEERTSEEISWEFEADDGAVKKFSVRFTDEEARAEATRLMVRASQRFAAAAFGGKGAKGERDGK